LNLRSQQIQLFVRSHILPRLVHFSPQPYRHL
jgi:hypothetical protein